MADAAMLRPAILFDLDGTLVDTIALLLSSMRHAFTTVGIATPSDAAWTAGIGTPLATQFRDFVTDDPTVARLIAAYREYQYAHHDEFTRCYAGIPALVRRLEERGHQIGIVTSKADHLANRALAWVGLAGHVDVVIGADSVERHKPHPEPVLVALQRLGVAPADAVFVGDSPHDVAAGNAAGVRTIGVTWGAFGAEELAEADLVVGSVAELETALAGGP
jgi:pyrophosphatase PpaX